MSPSLEDAIRGTLLGTAAGDLIGLPFENLSRRQVEKLLCRPLEPSLLGGRGLVSDDTEHTLMVAEALVRAQGDLQRFPRELAADFRRWLATLPPAVGGATARGILKSCIGFSPARSGVFSAGNGAAMRVALLGVVYAQQPVALRQAVTAATLLTHTDPKALAGALAVAVAASTASSLGAAPATLRWAEFHRYFQEIALPQEATLLATGFSLIQTGLTRSWSVAEFADQSGCPRGVSGYVLETVPVALYAWLRHGNDYREAVSAVVACGGDTDTVGAITGALLGAGLGPAGIPPAWLTRHWEFLGVFSRLGRLADALLPLAQGQPPGPWPGRWLSLARMPGQLLRNLVMLGVIFYVLLRRTLGRLLP